MPTIATLSLASIVFQSSSAFQFQRQPIFPSSHVASFKNDHDRSSNNTVALRAPSLPADDGMKRLRLPPLPDDPIALGGDVLALFVYTYLDHTINEAFTAEAENVADLVISDPATPTSILTDNPVHLPVWFDTEYLHTFGHNWLANPATNDLYAPAIADSGLAFVALSTAWILCGYVSGAFLNSNTLEGTSSNALKVTLRTWLGTALLMVALSAGSDALWGWLDGNWNALSAPARGGLTKADADFIFDSLSVLAFWRFTYHYMFNSQR